MYWSNKYPQQKPTYRPNQGYQTSQGYQKVQPTFHTYSVQDVSSGERIEFSTMEFANPTALCVKATVSVTGGGLAPMQFRHTYWIPNQKSTNYSQLLEYYLKGGDPSTTVR